MDKWLVYVTYINNPDKPIQGLITANDCIDAIEEGMKILAMADEIEDIEVDIEQPFTSDDLYLTDLDGSPIFNISIDLNIELEYYQTLTKKLNPDIRYLDKLINHFEKKEQYEKCTELVKIKSKKEKYTVS